MRHDSGFTLLELLISLTIIAVIVVITSGAFRIGIRAWEKGEHNIETNQRIRIVLDLINHQTASICPRNIKNEDGKDRFFNAENKSLSFLSYMPLVPGNTFSTVYVKYVVEKGEDDAEHLFFYEKNIVLSDKETAEPAAEEFHELIQAHTIEFDYLRKEDNEVRWQPSWDPENDKGFPLAIRISLKRDKESAPIRVIARVHKDTTS